MNKILSLLNYIKPYFILIFVLVLIFVTLPIKIIELMIYLEFAFSVWLLCISFLKKRNYEYVYTKLVGPFCLLACGIAIATTRAFLTVQTIEEQIPIVVYIGNFICRENYFSGFFATLMMCTAIIAFCKMYISNQSEKAARFSLDGMSSKLFDIDQQLANNQISEEEAIKKRKAVQQEIDIFSLIDGSTKFILSTIKALAFLFIIALAGGVGIGILDLNMNWQDSLNQYIMLSSGYLVILIVPLFLISLSCKVNVKLEISC